MSGVSRVYGQQVSMEWDNEFTDNGNIETGAVESLDNTRSWLQTLDRGRVSSTSSVNTSRRSSVELDLSRGESVISTVYLCANTAISDPRYMARYPPSGRSSVDRDSEENFLSSVANYQPTFKRRLSQGLSR